MGEINLNNLQQPFISKLDDISNPSSKGGEKITTEEIAQLEQTAQNDDEKAFVQKLKEIISIQLNSDNDGKADSAPTFEFVDDAVAPVKEENKTVIKDTDKQPVLRPLNLRPWTGYEAKETYTPVADFQKVFPSATKGNIPVLPKADAAKFMDIITGYKSSIFQSDINKIEDLQKLIGAKIDGKIGPETFLKLQEKIVEKINSASKSEQCDLISLFLVNLETEFPALANNARHQELKANAQLKQLQESFTKASKLEDYQAIASEFAKFVNTFAPVINNNNDLKTAVDAFNTALIQKITELTPKPEPQVDPKLQEAKTQFKQLQDSFTKASKLEDYKAIADELTKFGTTFSTVINNNTELKTALDALTADVTQKIIELTPPPVPEKAGSILKLLLNEVVGKKGEKISNDEKPLVAKLLKDATAEDMAYLAKNLDTKEKKEIYNLYSLGESAIYKKGDVTLKGRLTALAYLSGDVDKVKYMVDKHNTDWFFWADNCDDVAREAVKILTDEKVNKLNTGKPTLPMKIELMKALNADGDKENKEAAIKILQQSSKEEFVKLANAFGIKNTDDLNKILEEAGNKGKNIIDIFGFDPRQLVW